MLRVLKLLISKINPESLLEGAKYLAFVAIASPGMIAYFSEIDPNRWLALGIISAFGFMMAIGSRRVSGLTAIPPGIYLSIQTILLITLLILPPHYKTFLFLFFILSGEAMTVLNVGMGLVWILIFSLSTAITTVVYRDTGDDLSALPLYLGGYLLFGLIVYTSTRAQSARKESQALFEELSDTYEKLQEYMVHSEELIVAQERNRLAREMHDTLGHQLTVSSIHLEGAQRLIVDDPQRAADIIDTVRTQIRDALSELRATVATLRQPLLSGVSIVSALKQLGAGFEDATDIQTKLVVVGEFTGIPDAHRNVIYRAAQEALTNVHRHANASNVFIRLDCGERDVVQLTITDNGVGFPSQPELKGFGLQGLKERVALLNGELGFPQMAKGGACIQISLPIDEGSDDE